MAYFESHVNFEELEAGDVPYIINVRPIVPGGRQVNVEFILRELATTIVDRGNFKIYIKNFNIFSCGCC